MPSGRSGTEQGDARSTGPTTHLYMRKDLPKQNYISMGQGINIKKKQKKTKKSKTEDLQTARHRYLSAMRKLWL